MIAWWIYSNQLKPFLVPVHLHNKLILSEDDPAFEMGPDLIDPSVQQMPHVPAGGQHTDASQLLQRIQQLEHHMQQGKATPVTPLTTQDAVAQGLSALQLPNASQGATTHGSSALQLPNASRARPVYLGSEAMLFHPELWPSMVLPPTQDAGHFLTTLKQSLLRASHYPPMLQ